MISERYKFIYLHVPKTGGNSISHSLLHVCDDEIYTEKHHDGRNRFGLRNSISANKHAVASVYASYLNERFDQFRLAISVRHPFKRAVSFFFSPHRWQDKLPADLWTQSQPVWDEEAFLKFATPQKIAPMHRFLDVSWRQSADVTIRAEDFEASFQNALSALGIPSKQVPALAHVNRGNYGAGQREKVLSSVELRDRVEAIYSQDMELFGYDTYQHR